MSPPARKGPWEYFTRTFEGSQYAAHGRRPTGSAEGTDETVLLDENELAAGLDYFSLGGLALSPDQRRLAYSFDDDGGELHTLRFRDLATGTDLADVIDGVYYGLAWANDAATIFYVRPDDAMRPFQVWRHTIGTATTTSSSTRRPTSGSSCRSVGRAAARPSCSAATRSSRASRGCWTPTTRRTARRVVVEPRTDDPSTTSSTTWSRPVEQLFVLTNADGATNFKVVRAPVGRPGRAAWTESSRTATT